VSSDRPCIITTESWGSVTGEDLLSNYRFLPDKVYSRELENGKRYGTYLINCAPYFSYFLYYKRVHVALPFTTNSKVTEAQLIIYTSKSIFLLKDKILYSKSDIPSIVALQPFICP
jgi:hypothetical protein